ncbi:hypothetical protein FHW12_003152 [Dokdonella fugitiva]|uniref:Lipoprotein n=1 Tax=Dokdonella fugitiva TaxID=328517 RepID=A0A839F2V2_9GAMM|nr:hypothetical protein [Dokdonella fugitiva]MBA8888916.1 hypothetical protein [Dokdonella fugitiva]
MMRRVFAIAGTLLLAACEPGGFSSTRIDDHTYRVELSACSTRFRSESEVAQVRRRLQNEADRLCGRGKAAAMEEPEQVIRSSAGSVLGECSMLALESTLTCK